MQRATGTHHQSVHAHTRSGQKLSARTPIERIIWVITRRRNEYDIFVTFGGMFGMHRSFQINQMHRPRHKRPALRDVFHSYLFRDIDNRLTETHNSSKKTCEEEGRWMSSPGKTGVGETTTSYVAQVRDSGGILPDLYQGVAVQGATTDPSVTEDVCIATAVWSMILVVPCR
jgi:hypothetical protein